MKINNSVCQALFAALHLHYCIYLLKLQVSSIIIPILQVNKPSHAARAWQSQELHPSNPPLKEPSIAMRLYCHFNDMAFLSSIFQPKRDQYFNFIT